MHRIGLLLLAGMLFITPAYAQFTLKQIATVGNSVDDEYLFFRIGAACFSDDEKFFYITDLQRHRVNRYTIEGRFAGSYGRLGQGPHDFLSPIGIQFHQGEVYVHDLRNKKLAVFDAELKPTRVIRLPGVEANVYATENFRIMGRDSYFFTGFKLPAEKEKLLDSGLGGGLLHYKKGSISFLFDRARFKLEKNLSEKDIVAADHFCRKICFGFNRADNEILLTFFYANNPPLLYLLDAATGRVKKSFPLQVDRNYLFPEALRRGKVEEKPGDCHLIVSDIFPYRDGYLVFYLFVNVLSGGAKQGEYHMQVLDRQGRARQDILLEGQYRFLAVSENGLLLAKNHDDDEEKIYIFRLE